MATVQPLQRQVQDLIDQSGRVLLDQTIKIVWRGLSYLLHRPLLFPTPYLVQFVPQCLDELGEFATTDLLHTCLNRLVHQGLRGFYLLVPLVRGTTKHALKIVEVVNINVLQRFDTLFHITRHCNIDEE